MKSSHPPFPFEQQSLVALFGLSAPSERSAIPAMRSSGDA